MLCFFGPYLSSRGRSEASTEAELNQTLIIQKLRNDKTTEEAQN